MTEKPTPLAPVIENIPDALKQRNQWVLWKYLPPKPGQPKWRKVPYQVTGQKARTNDPDTWSMFAAVWTVLEAGGYDGIGYVFCPDDPYIGIDWDHSFNREKWETNPDVNVWLVKLNTYTELSASGEGIHSLIEAKFPFDRGRKTPFVEVYKTKRFFTVTGHIFDGLPGEPQSNQEGFDELVATHLQDKRVSPLAERPRTEVSFDDAQIIERCRHAKNSAKFLSLWEGRWQGYGYPSQSEAEFALLGILRFWTQDSAQLSRLMESSGMWREKWNSKRGSSTYGGVSIENSLSIGGETYRSDTPSGPRLIIGSNNKKAEISYPLADEADKPDLDDDDDDEEESEEVGRPRYVLHWLSEAFGPDEPVEWIVAGLFQKGSINLLHGAPGTKKTYALLDLAMCLLLGRPWLGRETTGGTVLLIDEESGPKRLNRRLKEVARGHGVEPSARLAYTTLEMFDLLNSNADLGYIEEIIEKTAATLVVVDALADVMPGGDENEVKDTHPVFQKLKMLAHKHNCCIIVIHHSNKGGRYRGSSAIPGVVDVMLKLESPAKTNQLIFTIEKNRDGEEDSFGAEILFQKEVNSVQLIKAEIGTTQSKERASIAHVLDFLRRHGGGAFVNDIIGKPQACSPQAARMALYELAGQGRIIRTDKGGKGAQAYYELCQ